MKIVLIFKTMNKEIKEEIDREFGEKRENGGTRTLREDVIVKTIDGYTVIIDKEDLEKFNMYTWHTIGTRNKHYVASQYTKPDGRKGVLRLHRYLTEAPGGFDVDHINGNELDNRKSNLRICTTLENCRNLKIKPHNTSGYKGVSWNKKAGKWYAQIGFNNKTFYIGSFDTPELASIAYEKKAQELYGEFYNKESLKAQQFIDSLTKENKDVKNS